MLAIAEPCATPKPSVSIVPHGTDMSFCFIPSTSYWTFIRSLRDWFTLTTNDLRDPHP